jgi:hypothetical protein
MAAAGTLLSDLDGTSGGGDGDLVQKILSDMNIPSGGGSASGGGGRPVPPPMQQQMHMPQQQGGMNRDPGYASSTQNMTMDSRIPTSHMIGNEHPTPADFAAAMTGVASVRPDVASMSAPFTHQQASSGEAMPGFAPAKANIYGRIVQEIKVPFVVALLFFVFSLPPIRVLVSHYMRTMIKPTGELNMIGLAFISLVVGAVFWLLQRVIAPLLSL